MSDHQDTEHDELLIQWRSRRDHASRGFVSDGVVDPAHWEKAPVRVLFLLKEAYGDPGATSDWDLRQWIRDAAAARWLGGMFWTTAYWAFLAHHRNQDRWPRFPDDDSSYDQALESLLGSAVVNIKKSGGSSVSDNDDLARFVSQDGDLLARQIELIRPQIMICGATWPLVKHLFSEAKPLFDRVWQLGDSMVIDYYHPAHRGSNHLYYFALAALFWNTRQATS